MFPLMALVALWVCFHSTSFSTLLGLCEPSEREAFGTHLRIFSTLSKGQNVDPEVLQSGFGVNFWSSEFLENCQRISQQVLMVKCFLRIFGPCFSRVSGPPPRKIHAQNSRPNLLAFLSNFTFSNSHFFFTPIFCLRGRPRDDQCSRQE